MVTVSFCQRVYGRWGMTQKRDMTPHAASEFIKSMWNRRKGKSKLGDKALISISGTLTEISETWEGAGYVYNFDTHKWGLPA